VSQTKSDEDASIVDPTLEERISELSNRWHELRRVTFKADIALAQHVDGKVAEIYADRLRATQLQQQFNRHTLSRLWELEDEIFDLQQTPWRRFKDAVQDLYLRVRYWAQ
jgi:hypothetical protein